VLAGDGSGVGRVRDLAIRATDVSPSIVAVQVSRRRHTRLVPWQRVATFGPDAVQLRPGDDLGADRTLRDDEMLLRRHVLDAQIVNVGGRRLVRVGDVELEDKQGTLAVVAVEVGAAAVLRRLGLGRIARRMRPEAVPWTELHPIAGRAHQLQLRGDRLGRLGPAALAEVVGRMPLDNGLDVLRSVPPELAAESVAATHPQLGGRVLQRIDTDSANTLIEHMPIDDAASALRHVDRERLDDLLMSVGSARAADLRRLLQERPGTAGGLMTLDVRTAPEDESIETTRRQLAERPPAAPGLGTVVVIDGERRPVGVLSPSALLQDAPRPRPVRPLALDTPVDTVVDMFALQDVLALPVVDAEGRLAGVVAIDDVLDVLLAERLPGRSRYARVLGARKRAPT
jgi:CBS domain-containing protein/sporulation protein YlmC with PRC-barrel domain